MKKLTSSDLAKLERSLRAVKSGTQTIKDLDNILDSGHSGAIEITENLLNHRFLKELLVDPDVYDPIQCHKAYENLSYISPTRAELHLQQKREKDEYQLLKMDSKLLQLLFQSAMWILAFYILGRSVLEAII